jgi:hypothetical protein
MTDKPELLPCHLKEKYIIASNGCWEWIGAIQSRGYGSFRGRLAHRVFYTFLKGRIPNGLTIDHKCRNRKCVNPDHLEAVTQYENNMRGESPTAINKKKSTCINGHDLNGENIRIVKRKDGVRRKCNLCQKIYRKRKQND